MCKQSRSLIIFVFCLCLFVKAYSQRDTVAFNEGWKFVKDTVVKGNLPVWDELLLDKASPVTLPHTWNIQNESENHYGWGWYQKKIFVPLNWAKKNIVLQFGAVNHSCYIFLNGKKIAEHLGDGFNKFYVQLSNELNYGKQNTITVASNNDYGKNKIPYSNSFDWPNDGGIIRPVALIISGKPAVSFLHANPAINIKDSSAVVSLSAEFYQTVKPGLKFEIKIVEENQATDKTIFNSEVKPTWNDEVAKFEISLPKVKLWHFDFPNLYKIETTVYEAGKPVDKVSAITGFREIKFVNGQTFLNGERVKLMGVEWTIGSDPRFGFAEPDSVVLRYARLMKEVNCIFSRTHMPQSDLFLDYCDRNGILMQEEIPAWGWETPSSDEMNKICTRQVREMIRNHYNHPSIIFWGVGNELSGHSEGIQKMVASLIEEAKKLNPARQVNYVSNTITEKYYNVPNFKKDAGAYGDVIMMNEYGASWWQISAGQISAHLDSVHTTYPDKPLFISEFGLCEPNFKGGDVRRLEDLAYHMGVYESKTYVEGAIYFDLTDYRTHYGSGNGKYKQRIHGVYDMYGIPKPSMVVLREMSSPVEVQAFQKKKNGKAAVMIIGSIGLPQHIVKGYKLYLSSKTDNYTVTKAYEIPEIKPGEKVYVEVDDLYNGSGIVTVVRPLGTIVSQKSFYTSGTN